VFPALRRQLIEVGEDIPDVDENYVLLAPDAAHDRIAFGALPYLIHDELIHDEPFIQGITASAEIGAKIANTVLRKSSRARGKLNPSRWQVGQLSPA